MLLVYENRTDGIVVEWKKTVHFPPHLHEAIEVVYVTDGDIELGVGQELYHMDEGDFAIVFPNVIHHYQVFGKKENKVIYLYLDPTLFPSYYKELQIYSPKNPVVKKEQVHPDVVNAIKYLAGITEGNPMLIQAYVQMILAHVFAEMPMVDKSTVGSDDLIYNAVEYVAKNFREKISLEKMAYDLCVSKYVLSRMFAKTFHCNFSKYVNGVRLNYAVAALENTMDSITNICLDCGFESQRTFNRFFTMTIEKQKNIALIAHDGKKQDMLKWCMDNKEILQQHNLSGTGTTARMIADHVGLKIKGYNSGPLGGDQQIGAKIVEGNIDMVIFFSDPLAAQPHDPDVKALLRIAQVYDIPIANNIATADFMIHSTLMNEQYSHQIENFKNTVDVRVKEMQ